MIGKTILHYKILSKLGEGGMGVVYRVEDTKLKREVAIKFLPRQIAASKEERERFKIEAQAAASLNHASIATIHNIEEDDDESFIVMEYIKGRELKDKIDAGPLPIEETRDIAIQIAQGLQIAHEAGVVHRDIKSSNIMLTDRGEIKIMDFGLAKRGGKTRVTQEGTTLGTIAYMSPEQTRGEEVDQRSDIFSLGVLIYEMLTGQLPFKGDYDQAVTYSILSEEPQPVTAVRSGIPMEFELLVNKCLDKDASTRYQHADELVADLTRLKKGAEQEPVSTGVRRGENSGSKRPWLFPVLGIVLVALAAMLYLTFKPDGSQVATQRIMLAVLPFENRGSPEDEYFSDGITEEITSRLAQIAQLGVIARTSAAKYKTTDKSIKEIGAELGVDYLLDGTVRWDRQSAGESRVRVTPELIKVSDETHLWTERYDMVLADVFQIQSDISEQVAQALRINLLAREREALSTKPTDNLDAYDLYLRGSDHRNRNPTERDLRTAESLFERAILLDPGFALAYAKLSEVHSRLYWFYIDRTANRLKKAKETVDQAFKLKPELPEAHAALGYYYYYGFLDYEQALRHFSIAEKRNPNDANILSGIGYVKRRQGQFDQSLAFQKRGFILDPQNASATYNLGQTHFLLRNYSEAERYYDLTLKIDPEVLRTYSLRFWLYLNWKMDTKMARSVLEDGSLIFGSEDNRDIQYPWIASLIFDGEYPEAISRLQQSEFESFDTQYYAIPKELLLAQIHDLMNQPDPAQAFYDSARTILEARVRANPEDERLYGSLGIAYAGLGLKDKAIEAGERGFQLMPIKKESMKGTYRLAELARIHVMIGEFDAAMDQLEQLLSIPSHISVSLLRLDPIWQPLRNKPRFQGMLKKYGGS